jgi:two-component system, cell cycle response regulator DivK
MPGKVVLLVEDQEENRDMYALRLRHAGYEVFEARDGDEALDLIARQRPDIILLDISIPIIDGYMVARIVKAIRDTSSIPIVALTAHDYDSNNQEASRVGFDRYLTKPIEPRQVVECVQELIGPPLQQH